MGPVAFDKGWGIFPCGLGAGTVGRGGMRYV